MDFLGHILSQRPSGCHGAGADMVADGCEARLRAVSWCMNFQSCSVTHTTFEPVFHWLVAYCLVACEYVATCSLLT